MRKVLISLADSTERRRAFFAQPLATGFDVFDAIDMRGAPAVELRKHLDVDRFRQRYGRDALPGEVGCLASHIAVIAQFAEAAAAPEERLIVCEDDAELLKGFDTVNVARFPKRLDLVVLGYGMPFSLAGMNEDRTIARFIPISPAARRLPAGRRVGLALPNCSMGLVGYSISAQAARRIAAIPRTEISWTADDFSVWANHGITSGLVQAGVVRQRTQTVSTIGAPAPSIDDSTTAIVAEDSGATSESSELAQRERRIAADLSRRRRLIKHAAQLLILDARAMATSIQRGRT